MNHNYSFDTVENMESEIKVEDIDFGFSRSNSLRLDKIVIKNNKYDLRAGASGGSLDVTNDGGGEGSQGPQASPFKTSFNLFRSFVGLGILTLPFAFSKAGAYFGAVLLLFISFLSYWGVKLYLEIARDLNFNGSKLQDLVSEAIGPKGGKFASVNIIVIQIAVSVASIIFCSDFLDFVFCEHHIDKLCHHKSLYKLYSFVISFFTVMIRNLSCFAYLNLIAVSLILSCVGSIYYYDLVGLSKPSETRGTVEAFRIEGFAAFVGMALFSMEGIGMVFPLRNSLKRGVSFKHLFKRVLMIVFAICCLFGFLTYKDMGESVKRVAFFSFGAEYMVLFGLEIGYATGIFLSFVMNLHPVFEIIKESKRFKPCFTSKSPCLNKRNEFLMRLITLIIVYIICFLGPDLIHFISFAGALFNSTLGILLPIITYHLYFVNKNKVSKLKLMFNMGVFIVGAAFSGIAVFDSAMLLFKLKSE